MSWISARVPERRERKVLVGNLIVFGGLCAVAAATSQAEDWQPLSLVLLLAVFSVASELLAVRLPQAHITVASTAPGIFAIVLLGPAPAVAISIVSLLFAAGHERTSLPDVVSNLTHYAATAVTAGLVCRWLVAAFGLRPDEPGFALLVLGVYTYVATLSFLLAGLYDRLAYGISFRAEYKREATRMASSEGPLALLTTATAYVYGNLGLGALGLLVVVQLAYQYLQRNLLISEQRAEALQQRADELAALQATLERQAERLSDVSASRGRLVGQVLQAEETERRRLAEALHDEALQNLLFARQGFPAGISDKADRAREAIARTIEQLRGAIFDLHPAILEHAGLEAALQEVADHQAERAGFQAEVDVDPEACGPLDSLLFVLGREQLTNAAKHSGATEVGLTVARNNGRVVMEVSDNGCGLEAGRRHSAVEQGHIGLASSAERVEVLGGELEIESRAGGGTRIRTTLPLRSS